MKYVEILICCTDDQTLKRIIIISNFILWVDYYWVGMEPKVCAYTTFENKLIKSTDMLYILYFNTGAYR